MKKQTQIIISFALVLGALGLWAWKSDGGKSAEEYFGNTSQSPLNLRGEVEEEKKIEIGNERYENSSYGFSLKIPEGARATSFEEEGGEAIVVSNGAGGYEIQIFVSPFDEDIVLTSERIRQDISDIKMKGEREVEVAGTKAIAFIDEETKTREVWFVKGSNLFQISSGSSGDSATAEILQSWEWES